MLFYFSSGRHVKSKGVYQKIEKQSKIRNDSLLRVNIIIINYLKSIK